MRCLLDVEVSPILSPQPLAWPGVVVILILGTFVLAALLGPMIRANMEDEPDDGPPPA